jgi:hypothetical protein
MAKRELAECCRQTEQRGHVGDDFVVAAAEVLQERMAGGDSRRRSEATVRMPVLIV